MSKPDLENAWINVVPQLLTGICRPEASLIMPQLKIIAEKYPQALLQSPFAALEEYHKGNDRISENYAKVLISLNSIISFSSYLYVTLVMLFYL